MAATGDFNGDGKKDVAVTNNSSDFVSVLLGNGDGTLGPATNFTVGHFPNGIAVGDLNGDGKLDFVTANYGASSLTRRLGLGNGSFGPALAIPTATSPRSVAV